MLELDKKGKHKVIRIFFWEKIQQTTDTPALTERQQQDGVLKFCCFFWFDFFLWFNCNSSFFVTATVTKNKFSSWHIDLHSESTYIYP